MTKHDQDNPHLKYRYALPDPYPEPRVIEPNPYYAMLLLEDYAGPISEMTAIHQYFYHYLSFEENYEDLAELEEGITISEMYHLELLGKTIRLLGVSPKFRTLTNNQTTFWSTGYIYYGTNIRDRLAADIAAKISATRQYRRHAKLIEDPCIRELLDRIILDEEQHLSLFRKAAAKYCPASR